MVELSSGERRTVEAALAATRDRRHWVRLRAVLLTADGVPSPEVCRDLGLGRSTSFAWLAAWRETRDPAALRRSPMPRVRGTRRCSTPPSGPDSRSSSRRRPRRTATGRWAGRPRCWRITSRRWRGCRSARRPCAACSTRSATTGSRPGMCSPGVIPSGREKKSGPGGRGGARAGRGAEHGRTL